LTKGGQPIYRNTALVFGAPKDTLIQHDAVATTATPASSVASLLAN